jgi:hypothetical protein
VVVDTGLWRIDGSDLHAAAETADQRREEGRLGEHALKVLGFVNGRDVTRAADVVSHISGIDTDYARQCLHRLAEAGRIMKYGRGVYGPVTSVTNSEENVTDVTHTFLNVTHTFLKEDDEKPRCKHCADLLLHPESIARGHCAKAECLLKGDNE